MSDLMFLLDENIPQSIKRLLESKGFLAGYGAKGISDSKLLSLAKRSESVLITRDSDFLNTFLYPPKERFGIVVFRIHPPKAEKLVKALSLLLEEISDFKSKLFLVEETGFKVIEG